MKVSKTRAPGMWEVLSTAGTPHGEVVYAAFLKAQAEIGEHSFLLNDIRRSNLRPAAQAVAAAIITGKLKRPAHRLPAADTDMKNAWRALRVKDLIAEGWTKRDAAIEEAKRQMKCGRRTIEKALADFEEMLDGADPEFLASLRTAFK